MKKVTALVMVLLLLLTCSAFAETVIVPVWGDDASTDVEMVVYKNTLGFSMAYDPAHFAPAAEDPDIIRFTDYDFAFISFDSYTGFTMNEWTAGLVLQSGTEECTVDDAAIGGLLGESIEVTAVLYTEMLEGIEYEHSFFLLAHGAEIYGIECFYPLELTPEVSADFSAMMQTIAFAGGSSDAQTPAAPSSDMVQCEACGKWFHAGNEFRNHICTAVTYPSEDNMVQCEVCGQWFHPGNEFRNHICTAETYPSEDNLVQCEVCGKWFHPGNEFRNHVCTTETYPSEDNLVQCEVCGQWFHPGNEFRNHVCVTETYPSEDNMVETYPSEDNWTETYPSEDNWTETYPSEDNWTETYPSEDNEAD